MSCKWWFSHFHSVLPRDQHRVTCASSIIHNFYYYLHTFNQGLEEDRLRPHCSSEGTFLNFQFKSLHSIVTLFTFPLFLCTPSHNKQQHPPHNTTAISPFLHFTPTSDLPPLHHCMSRRYRSTFHHPHLLRTLQDTHSPSSVLLSPDILWLSTAVRWRTKSFKIFKTFLEYIYCWKTTSPHLNHSHECPYVSFSGSTAATTTTIPSSPLDQPHYNSFPLNSRWGKNCEPRNRSRQQTVTTTNQTNHHSTHHRMMMMAGIFVGLPSWHPTYLTFPSISPPTPTYLNIMRMFYSRALESTI